MDGIRLILALHDHQPVGNFDGVFESAYQDSYRPFLDVLEDYPDVPFVLHTSGPLLEWLVERHPDYIDRLRKLVAAGRLEVLGGGFYEPILTMLPHRDRVGQLRTYSEYLGGLFGAPVRGAWTPERVWEQHLVGAYAEAGIEYTVLDDFHFQRAGIDDARLFGYYLTEDQGDLLKVFPSCERLRYLMPYLEPHATYEFLRRLADERPGATVVFADDGEKFGTWPETHLHVYTYGWLRRFCDMLVGNRSWLRPTTFARAVDETLPLGKVFLPDSSYREMTEWALPTERQAAFEEARRAIAGHPGADRVGPFLRAAGFWRNFRAKYPESDEMYARMLGISRRLDRSSADRRRLVEARRHLYRGQCNCPYWHGAFGGLYLPHLRNAIYGALIAAHNALDAAEGQQGPRVRIEAEDFNLDARKEVVLENDRLIAFVRPAQGGHLYELDDRARLVNVLATLDRRPEPYHQGIASTANGHLDGSNGLKLKQDGLENLLIYDRAPRKAFVDHVYPLDVSLEDLVLGRDRERGDFVSGAYLAEIERRENAVALVLRRPGHADGALIQVRKVFRLEAGSPTLEVHYALEDLPRDRPILFAVEINHAGMAGHAEDRTFADLDGNPLGMLDSRLCLEARDGLVLTDEWLGLASALRWSRPAGVWCFPIETVSQSEGGCEAVYQSSAIIPHWRVLADDEGRWDVRITWTLDRPDAPPAAARSGLVLAASNAP